MPRSRDRVTAGRCCPAAKMTARRQPSNLPANFPSLEKFHVRLFAGRFIGSMHFPKTPEEITLGPPRSLLRPARALGVILGVRPPGLRPCARTAPPHLAVPNERPTGRLRDAGDRPLRPPLPRAAPKLCGFCFDMHDRLEGFVVNRCATLASLVLDSCPMCTGDGFKNKIPQRRWSQVIARFEEALTALTRLRVMVKLLWGPDTEDLPRADMILTYETSTSGYGYNLGEPVDTTVEADDQRALAKLYATVDARRRSIEQPPLDRAHI
ncbi:hypothetical protein DAEQUDRAFT_336330 [Daedalea quercina L-15889]|uniref:Uncharacterized protein n=1 Tax=Daedalea quercina L-15889 TaxID=1314783 RepID=A0A165PI89_9APHY|nr:hypothetical protein DAEQUDRAFT_336330 [Daedalea quercina L-15889]